MSKYLDTLANALSVAAAVALFASCGGGSTLDMMMSNPPVMQAPETPDAGHPSPADAGQAAPDTGTTATDAGTTSAPIDLGGTWAAKIVTSQIVNVALSGNQTETLTALAHIDVAFSAGTAMLTVRMCKIDLAPIAGLTTVYPQSAIDAIPPAQATARIGEVHVGTHYASMPYTSLLGWTSQSPTTDALPTTTTDPRVIDEDHDGHPGVTLQTMGFITADVYIVNRTTIALDGTVMSADKIQGLVTADSEQVILDATNSLIPRGPLNAMRDPSAANSTFTLVRLKQAQNQCADIIANAASLFP
jgi:hypothetical protein